MLMSGVFFQNYCTSEGNERRTLRLKYFCAKTGSPTRDWQDMAEFFII
jgi:hypothetical protein